MFALWFRLNAHQKKKVWRLYGFFTGLGCIGSIFGAIASCAEIKYEENLYEAMFEQNLAAQVSWRAEVAFWVSILLVPESLQVLFISITLLMVLDRMVHVAFATSSGLSARIALAQRAVMSVVVVLNATSLCLNAMISENAHRVAPFLRSAASAAANNDTASSSYYFRQAKSLNENFDHSMPQNCESASLLFILANFIIVLRVCSRRIRQINERAIAESSSRLAQQSSDVPSVGIPSSGVASDSTVRVSFHTSGLLQNMKAIHLQIFVTVVFVFVALLVMVVVKLIDSLSDAFQNDCSAEASSLDCHPCRNSSGLIQSWFRSTPELWSLGVSMPQPLALLVALWAMTSKFMLQMIKSPRQEANLHLTPMQEM